jgi:ABC-2 type transport system ATP-binding protein
MDVIEDVCDRVVIMNDGQVVVDDTVEDLLAGFETRGYRITARGGSDAVLSDLQERFELTDVHRTDDRLRFDVAADTETFYGLTSAMEAHGLDVASVETVQPDLAEVFVEMTNGTTEPGHTNEAETSTPQESPTTRSPASDGGDRR